MLNRGQATSSQFLIFIQHSAFIIQHFLHKISNLAPSTTSVVPLTKRASDEAKKQMAAARSAGSPTAPWTFSLPLLTFGLFHNIGVFTAPGAMQFTRILRSSHSSASTRMNASIAPLDAAY